MRGADFNDNCLKEFKYADRTKSGALMIPILMDPSMGNQSKWKGPVGMTLGTSLYANCSDDGKKFEDSLVEVYRLLQGAIADNYPSFMRLEPIESVQTPPSVASAVVNPSNPVVIPAGAPTPTQTTMVPVLHSTQKLNKQLTEIKGILLKKKRPDNWQQTVTDRLKEVATSLTENPTLKESFGVCENFGKIISVLCPPGKEEELPADSIGVITEACRCVVLLCVADDEISPDKEPELISDNVSSFATMQTIKTIQSWISLGRRFDQPGFADFVSQACSSIAVLSSDIKATYLPATVDEPLLKLISHFGDEEDVVVLRNIALLLSMVYKERGNSGEDATTDLNNGARFVEPVMYLVSLYGHLDVGFSVHSLNFISYLFNGSYGCPTEEDPKTGVDEWTSLIDSVIDCLRSVGLTEIKVAVAALTALRSFCYLTRQFSEKVAQSGVLHQMLMITRQYGLQQEAIIINVLDIIGRIYEFDKNGGVPSFVMQVLESIGVQITETAKDEIIAIHCFGCVKKILCDGSDLIQLGFFKEMMRLMKIFRSVYAVVDSLTFFNFMGKLTNGTAETINVVSFLVDNGYLELCISCWEELTKQDPFLFPVPYMELIEKILDPKLDPDSELQVEKVKKLRQRIVDGYVSAGILDVYARTRGEKCRYDHKYIEIGFDEQELIEFQEDLINAGILERKDVPHPGTLVCKNCGEIGRDDDDEYGEYGGGGDQQQQQCEGYKPHDYRWTCCGGERGTLSPYGLNAVSAAYANHPAVINRKK